MARRAHYATSGRALPWILVTLVVVAGIGAGAFFLLHGPEAPAEEIRVPPFEFEVTDVRTVRVDGKASSDAVRSASGEIAAVLSGLYDAAFVQPDAWGGGRFPSLGSFFAGAAAEQAVGEDLQELTLGADARRVELVRPRGGTVEIDLLFDPEQEPYAAIARTTFEATGKTRDGAPLQILHSGRYVVRPVDGAWLVVGYEVDGSLETGKPAEGVA